MPERNFDNRTLFWGDNIDFLRAMNSQTVDLIATDPPFNKGRDFHATPDSLAAGASFQDRWKWDEEAHPQFTDALRDDPKNADVWNVIQSARSSWGDDMGAFLCFMGVRLLEMRRVLKPTGSIYLHCDPTASHYLKALMDAVFGRQNFRNEVVWHYRRWTGGAKHFQKMHDILFRYTKSDKFTFNTQYEPYGEWIKKDYGYVDEETGKRWRWHTVKGHRYKVFLEDEDRGVKLNDVWIIPYLGSTSKERTGYPTQKPLALYERIIRASSNLGDMVLDPFAGCATTCVAAERLERQWVGIDLWEETKNLIVSRLEAEKRMFAVEQLTVTQTPPQRTDEGDVASPDLRLRMSRQPEKWQRLYRQQIFDYLQDAQTNSTGLVTCAGCGRSLEYEFMELDHIFPRAEGGENYITNRILLCRPCNGWKSNNYTLAGLRNRNKREGWMVDEAGAESAQLRARRKADEVREALG